MEYALHWHSYPVLSCTKYSKVSSLEWLIGRSCGNRTGELGGQRLNRQPNIAQRFCPYPSLPQCCCGILQVLFNRSRPYNSSRREGPGNRNHWTWNFPIAVANPELNKPTATGVTLRPSKPCPFPSRPAPRIQDIVRQDQYLNFHLHVIFPIA